MAEEHEKHEPTSDSLIDKITEKFHSHDSSSSSSSDSDNDRDEKQTAKIYRLFGREKPVHKVLGGGKHEESDVKAWNYWIVIIIMVYPWMIYVLLKHEESDVNAWEPDSLSFGGLVLYFAADIFLWRDKKISGGLLAVATTIWVFFELLEYHLLSLVCHILILALAVLFLWSNASTFINKSPPKIPEVILPEDIILGVASAFRVEFNRTSAIIRDIARGRDLKKFLTVIVGLWVLSILGSWCSFLTLFYIGFILVHTVPVIYEKYDDRIDAFAERAEAEFKKQYAVFDAKVLSKIPKGIKDKLP